ncbi:glycosyltransferase [Symbioplanes lichenis]|uniref:glycosyltransferase n=1 Tax=Symbioplanes lichenis TaxID=1629072 RepID=UPI002739E30D|nr:nucleotide disphospho-sugar-binding domain-containing protein [Actinoplanes lichenis]
MRILFSSSPAFGHLLPMLPLAAAARRAGHETAVLTHPSLAGADPALPLLPAGPSQAELLADITRRTGVDALQDPAVGAVEFFIGSRMRLGAADAVAAARQFAPDLIVAELVDYLGQFAAAVLGVPWVSHGATLPLVPPLAEQFAHHAALRFAEHGATPTPALAYVDPWPDSLVRPTDHYPYERLPVRPDPHIGDGAPWSPPAFPGREDRPTVLITLGTVHDDPAILRAVVDDVAALDVNVIAGGAAGTARENVAEVGFVPMRDLLDASDLVVSAAGAGTMISTLGAGLPSVLLPLGLDKPVNAERAAATGAALVATAPGEIGALAGKVLSDPSYAGAARAVAAEIAAMPAPEAVLDQLLARV